MMMRKVEQFIQDKSLQITEGLNVKLNLINVFYLTFWTLNKSQVFKQKGYESNQ